MNSCNTCYFNITDYDERDRAYHYCHLTLEPIKENKKDCKEYKPHDKKRYIERQWKRVLSNLTIILEMTVGCNQNDLDYGDIELIYSCANDSMCRLEEIQQYIEGMRK